MVHMGYIKPHMEVELDMAQTRIIREFYRSLVDGRVWIESKSAAEVVARSAGKNATFEKITYHEVTEGWQSWDPRQSKTGLRHSWQGNSHPLTTNCRDCGTPLVPGNALETPWEDGAVLARLRRREDCIRA